MCFINLNDLYIAHHNLLGIRRQLKIRHLYGTFIFHDPVYLYGDRKLACLPVFVCIRGKARPLRRKMVFAVVRILMACRAFLPSLQLLKIEMSNRSADYFGTENTVKFFNMMRLMNINTQKFHTNEYLLPCPNTHTRARAHAHTCTCKLCKLWTSENWEGK